MPTPSQRCAELITEAGSVVVLTGAGISTSSGIADFRGPQGLYVTRRYDPQKVFDIDYFSRDPKPFFDFARDFIGLEEKIQPTSAHRFFARLEAEGKLTGVITQNIDDLHQRAGSKNVLEVHGSFLKSFCRECAKAFSFEELRAKIVLEEIPYCPCGGVIKPDIVFFGEDVKRLAEAFALAHQADLFFVVGTSCSVYPAASIPESASRIVIVNNQPVNNRFLNVVLEVSGEINGFFNQVAERLDLKVN